MPLKPFLGLLDLLNKEKFRYVMIGVAAANYYAETASKVFMTEDRDFLLPLDADNLLAGWSVSQKAGFTLWSSGEPLEEPADRWLAERVVDRRALTSAIHPDGIVIDFALEMTGFTFERVWNERRTFQVENTEIPVARISQIIESKARTGRPKDRLFLATYEEELHELMQKDES